MARPVSVSLQAIFGLALADLTRGAVMEVAKRCEAIPDNRA
jgi:hypothetical protein